MFNPGGYRTDSRPFVPELFSSLKHILKVYEMPDTMRDARL